MGAYLSKPNTEKDMEEGQGNRLEYGAGSMQGWRVSQEDAHNCVTDLDDKSSLFAVYDGHGGPEVAIYLARRFPDFLKKTEAYKSGNWERALHEAYVQIDSHMKTGEAIIEIQKIAKREAGDDSADNIADYEEEDVSELCEEATMPIHDLLQKITGIASGIAAARANGALASSEADSADDKPGSSKSLRMELGGEGSSSSATSSSFAYASGSNDRTEEPGTCDSANDVPNSSSAKVSASGENSIDADDGECSSSSRVESVKSAGVMETAEAEAGGSTSVSPQSSTLSVPKQKTDKDVEPSSSTNEADREVNLVGTSSTIPKVNGTKDILNLQEPDSTEADSSSSKASKDAETPSSAAMKPNGEADSTQNETAAETPRRKGKTHPPPVTTPPPSAQRRSQRKKVNDAQVYENFLNDASDSDSDEEVTPGPAFDHGDSSDEDEEADENSSSSNEGSEEGDEEEDDDDDEEMEDDVKAHHLLHDVQEPGYDSGSTAVVAFFQWDAEKLHLYVANAGDSRCVVSRNGVAIDMSHDHKPEDETEARRIVRAGGKVTQDGRVNGGLNLSRALGDHSYKQNDSLPAEDQMITPVPDIRHEILDPGTDQFVVLACDGVWNSMSSQEVVDFVIAKMKEGHKISEICGEIFDYCLAPDTSGDGTGCDNMTAIIVKLPAPPNGNSVPAGEPLESGKRRLSSPDEEEETKRLKADFE